MSADRVAFAQGQVWVPRIGRSSMPRLIQAPVRLWPGRRAWQWRHVPPGTRTDVWTERRLRAWVREHRAVCMSEG